MKTIKFILSAAVFIMLSFTISSVHAQHDGNYKHQFPFVDSKGTIKDKSGTTLGTVTKDGIIKNHKGEKVAFIDNNGNLVDKDGKVIGKAEKNGNFHNINGEIEYTVKPSKGQQCEVYDKTGKVVAAVHNSYKAQAGCVAHCIETKMLMK